MSVDAISSATPAAPQQTSVSVGIMRIAGLWVPVEWKTDGSLEKLLPRLSEDFTATQTFAVTNALERKIPYSDTPLDVVPFVTVWNEEGQWWPAEIHADRITGIGKLKSSDLEPAKHWAKAWAISKNYTFCPEFGESAHSNSLKAL